MIDLKAIRAKLYAPAGWGCEKECGRDELEQLLSYADMLKSTIELAEWERYEWENKPWICWGEFLDAMNDMTIEERDEALAAWRKNVKALD